jgi:hypothetical protein
MWALLVSVTQDVIFYAFLLRLLHVFFSFNTCVLEINYWPIHGELGYCK